MFLLAMKNYNLESQEDRTPETNIVYSYVVLQLEEIEGLTLVAMCNNCLIS